MILFKGCEVYVPQKLGKQDVLVACGKILAVDDKISIPESLKPEVIQLKDSIMIPGLIDSHVHIAGAGGEGGPATRTPELKLSQILTAGITTVVGCLGTDGMTRNLESVLMKTKALRAQGVSAWMYTGSYQVPPPTILGHVGKDIALIDEIIGVGEIAVADHRSSSPSVEELIRLAKHARVGGLLGGKAGIVNIHMGNARNPFDILYQSVERDEMQFKQFLPTHCNRNFHILEATKMYGKKGPVDLTASHVYSDNRLKPSVAIAELVESGVPLENITISSDGCGSIPVFDEKGGLVRIDVGEPRSIFVEFLDLIVKEDWPVDRALQVVTTNVADILKLSQKGRITPGNDADVVILDRDRRIHYLVANGTIMVRRGKIVKEGSS